ncbi:glycosyltransferase family A protein [Aequorivita sp. Q41]|uniref:glycosyltransferase family A protein n=1 Tax=Aequorivita sp. Q41 TaxID=3153300 RepID=UPI0032424DFA
MLFHFLKYLQPTHYFQLYRNDGTSVFPIVAKLPYEIRKQLEPDAKFKSEKAREYDLSWQAVNKGYIGPAATYTVFERVPIIDEYRFLRKYFNAVWVFYVLLLRVFSLKNIFVEIGAWNASRKTKRSNYLAKPSMHRSWDSFESPLVLKKPFISVIIPTLNRSEYLINVLSDFEKQTYDNFEILIIDQSKHFHKDLYKSFNLTIHHVQQIEPALWLARNRAIKMSRGDIIALSEDDVRIPKDWIENHLKALDFFEADISAGVFFPQGHSLPIERSFFCLASQFATGNSMLYKCVFNEIGLFDRQFEKQRMGDGEFGLRAYLNGFKSFSNPIAYCVDVKAGTGGLREMGSWDAFRPKKIFAPRPIPSVLYFFRSYFGNKRSILAIIRTVPQSIVPYRFKKNKIMLVFGFFISVFLFPLVMLQVFISWRLASKKIQEGSKIEEMV